MVERVGTMILELVPAPGTGNFVLSSTPSVTGRQPWSFGVTAGWFVPPAPVMYFANDTTRQEWGLGTYSAGTLTRDTVLWTSAGSTAKLNFTLPVYVYPEIPAERSVYRDPSTGRLKAAYDISGPTQNQGQLAGHRNRIINSGFQVNQIGYTSGSTNLAANQYSMFARWRTGAAGCGLTFTSQKPSTACTVSAGTLQQVIDGTYIEGGTYTLSWAGAGTGRVNAGAYAVSPITVTGIAAGANVTVEFNTNAIVWRPQFEPGDTATAWEIRDGEEKLCERYRVYGQFDFAGQSVSGGAPLWFTITLPTLMRAQPSVAAAWGGLPGSNVNNIYSAFAISNRDIQVQTAIQGGGAWRFAGTYDAIAEL